MIFSSIFLLLTSFLDCISTIISLASGNIETNFVYKLLQNDLELFLAYKIALTLLFIFLNELYNKNNLSPAPWIIGSIWLLASIYNLYISIF